MAGIYTSADQLIGKTPLLELARIEKELGLKARILAKLEYFNPSGSAKDRAAKSMLDQAEAEGRLKPGSVIIEPTSGNTGIGLAAVAAARGYSVTIVMPETMSVERQRLMKGYGADLVLTKGGLGMQGAIKYSALSWGSSSTPPTPKPTGKPPGRKSSPTPAAGWTFLWPPWAPAAPSPAQGSF